VLYARVGTPHCLTCGDPIHKLSNEEITGIVKDLVKKYLKPTSVGKKSVMGVEWNETPVQIFAPLVRGRKGEHYQMLYDMLGKGFSQARIDGKMFSLRDKIEISKTKVHTIDFLSGHDFGA
jgi:excinuclease ABC subunit A